MSGSLSNAHIERFTYKSNISLGLLELARRTAEHSTSKRRVGAVIARNGQPLSLAANDMGKTHPKRYPKAHCAEFRAIRKAQTPIDGADIYVVRIRRDGTPGLSRPCIYCEFELRSYGISRSIYSTYDMPYYQIEVY